MNDHPVRILIVKVHSQANAGDQAIVLGQIQLLKKIVPAARLRPREPIEAKFRLFLKEAG